MLTLKLKIKSVDKPDLLEQYVSDYTHAFYKLYNNLELIADDTFSKSVIDNFCTYTYTCLKDNVETKYKQFQAFQDKQQKLLEKSQKELEILKVNTVFEKRRKFKLIKKIARIKCNLNKNICFGSKSLLREITKLKQTIQQQNLSESELIVKQNLINSKLSEFKSNRKIPIVITGTELFNGNKKFNFDLTNNKITYIKSVKGKVVIEFEDYKNQRKTLSKLQELTRLNKIPVTVTLSENYIYLTYDEAKLEGKAFNTNALNRERKGKSDDEKKEIYKKHIKEYEQFQLVGKIENRVAAIDLNPNFIGFSITDFNSNKLIHSVCYNLEEINLKTGKSSTDNKYQNRKRTHEIIHIYKDIFKLCEHFKVSKFGLEDLEFKEKVNTESKEFNRQTKNVWNRTLQTNQIIKHCNILGIKLELVNPIYSSFQGNLIFGDYDPIASSRIIAERAFRKYEKGFSVYQGLERINSEKLNYLLSENISDTSSWKQLYTKIGKLSYRNKEISQSKNFKHRKSKVILVI